MALVHHPVYNKNREVITSALTTLDLHDLARVAATYGLGGLWVVSPVEDQLAIAADMIEHWRFGWGAGYNSNRGEALSLVRLARDLDEARTETGRLTGADPLVVATSAADQGRRAGFDDIRRLSLGERPVMIVFGTAWGLTEEALGGCDYILEPITGPTDYNHLSVRSAAGIIIDRLFGLLKTEGKILEEES